MSARVDAVLAGLRAAATPEEHAKVRRRVGGRSELVVGVRMRDVFALATAHRDAGLDEVAELLDQPWYEVRVVAVSILDAKARSRRATQSDRAAWASLYLAGHDRIDTWDLVDRAAPRVVGGWLLGETDRSVLDRLARSAAPMERRTAITACFWLVRHGELDDALRVAALLVDDPEHLVLTNVGVALREVGRRDPGRRDAFLARHGTGLPAAIRRTALSR